MTRRLGTAGASQSAGAGGGGAVVLDAPLVSIGGLVTTYGGRGGTAPLQYGAGGAGGDGGLRVFSDCYRLTGAINPQPTHDSTAYGAPYSTGALAVNDQYTTPYATTLDVAAPGVLANDCASLGTSLNATL